MPDVAFAIPGDLATPTGGYIYDREVLARLPDLGIAARHLRLPAGYPAPTAADLAATAQAFSALPGSMILLVDGLAFGAMPESLLAEIRQPIVALVHHPLGYEAGLEPERAAELIAGERAALRFARRVIVTSAFVGRLLAGEFGVPAHRISVAVPGTEPAARAHGTGSPLQLLAVGALSPRKGYDILVEALAPLTGIDWRLTIAGAVDRSPCTFEALAAQIARRGLASRISLPGSLDKATLDKLYAAADLFVLPSLFEGYGMALAEAMARGLPIVCTTGGAAQETVPDDAGLKVPPGVVESLREALRRIMHDGELRRRLGDAAWRAGRELPDWDETARRVAAVIRDVPT